MIMSSSRTSSSRSNYTNSKLRKQFLLERRPQMLKDFLIDDSHSYPSSGFKSFPRRLEDRSMRNLIQIDVNAERNHSYSSNTKRLLRSRSKAAASTTISAFEAIINAVKNIKFNAVKSPSILPRRLSLRLSKKHNTEIKSSEKKETEIKMTVRIKDIIRWKSFRDLVEEDPQPSDLAYSPDHHHCATTTTGSTNSPCCNSNGSSWCESDFTAEDLPSWCSNSDDYLPGVGSDCMKATKEATANIAVGPKELSCDEKEHRSPVSVLDFQFEEDESLLSFNRTLDHMEKTKQNLMQRIQCLEGLAKVDPFNLEEWMSMEENDDVSDEDKEVNDVEETAMRLLNHVKATSSMGYCEDNVVVEQLLFDFFMDELSTRNDEIDSEMIGQAKRWINGEHSCRMDWEEYVKGMDKKFGKWNKFEEEQEEMALQIEIVMLNLLVDESLADFLVS
ncbi:hypothetical protein Pint_00335 [Pistacia integerrima]|uniref:Uncharacterized protein n=1 Tax=Pistacia integerrima TaxID=434235 RepID=A0ACC0ZLN1_9ROSI|nr:hypothetical protein Pint_00335 [Pistacia integerrima]